MRRARDHGQPLRLLFFGRQLKYKGLDTLVGALKILRSREVAVHLGVVGAGNLARFRQQLDLLDVEVINKWLDDDEVLPLLSRFDAMVLAHQEASQSGSVSAAFGCGMPVIALRVGGLSEQITDGQTGIFASGGDAKALVDTICQLAESPALYEALSVNIIEKRSSCSVASFLSAISSATKH